MLKPQFDYTLIVAQLPSQSPSEIDAALKALSEYCVTKGTSLPEGLEEQLLHVGNPSVLVSLARYCQSAEIFNILWNRATTATISSDSDYFQKGLRRACVLNRLAPLKELTSLSDPDDIWGNDKLEWLTDHYHRHKSETEKDYERWWNTVKLLQNENVPIRVLAAAISRNGAFSKLKQGDHERLIRHISSNPLLSISSHKMLLTRSTRNYEDQTNLRNAVHSLLDARTRRIDFRAALFDLLLSLTLDYRGEFAVPSFVLKQWQFPNMPEILANGGKTSEIINNPVELMPLVAFATWPVNVTAEKVPSFYTYAANYVTKNLTLGEMLDGIKKDGNLFCLLAIWNMDIMRSDTKRAMLQQMIAGHVPMAKPIPEEDLREIFDKRILVLEQNHKSIRGQKWPFGPISSISKLRWRARLRGVLGLSSTREHVMLEISSAIDVFQNGGPIKVFVKGVKHILGVFALLFTIFVLFDAFFLEGQELKALVDQVRTVISTLQ